MKDNKTKQISVRMTPLERILIEKRAKAVGKTLSRYMVDCATGVKMKAISEEEKQAFLMLSNYANNFARINNLLKDKKDISAEVLETARAIREHLKTFSK